MRELPVLALFTLGVAAGAHDLESAHAYAMTLADGTARIVLGRGGDCVLQVKANQRGVKRQCETISRIRLLVGTSKEKS